MCIIKEIVPTIPSRCLKSLMMLNYSYEDYSSVDTLIQNHSRDEILHTVCDVSYSYNTLKKQYEESLNSMKDNESFVVSYKINNYFNLRISDQIQIFYYDNRLRINGQKLFLWDYPENICIFGKRLGYSDDEIINDFVSINLLSYYFKYFLGIQSVSKIQLNDIIYTNLGYVVKDIVELTIDSHISLTYGDDKLYIADTWWYANDEIVSDLCSLPISEFGLKYKSFWC